MNEQMIRVPVEQVRIGDKISVGGVQMPALERAESVMELEPVVRLELRDDTGGTSIDFAPGTLIEVTREDPDAELVKIMAKGYWEADGSAWSSAFDVNKESTRRNMRAAIAAARAAGWRIERES